ncbi:acyl-CoA dehydrogenase family protein [Phototrophicus methaneseepsis]|uniref:Acyl-CoA dehydrogenase family protein n=1 Tax=Phototrophicus methaneseepsis TaxID=2710758 RepID=A0A7S8EDF5_9CHLR|nr:acyl-CoA dehydrogenase family protein [Phototrophicus methaneseepsis]QPC84906.1 acyl-CoA dehydrogenase family protein [Phototrophicus methaneseepsis]
MDFDLSDELKMFQRAVRDFCEKEIKPHAAHADETGELPWDAIHKMPDMGLVGLQVDEDYGGIGLDTLGAAIAVEELGRVCGSTGLSVSAHNGLGCGPIMRWGTDEQKSKWLPLLTSGEYLGALALTEPQAGSDLLNGAQTSAVRDGDSWVINGSKAWITNVRFAPVVSVLLRTDKEAGSRGFSMFLVEPDREGVTVHPPEKKMGLKASPTQMITFENVRVPASNLLGEEGKGFYMTMQSLDAGRVSIGALSVGLAQGAYEEMVRYAQDRQAFGEPIANKQLIQKKIADAAMELEAARLLVYKAAWMKDQGRDYSKWAAIAKLKASEVAEKVCFEALQIHGSYGYSREYPVERIYRDQRLMQIGEGTSEILRIVIARRVVQEFEKGILLPA